MALDKYYGLGSVLRDLNNYFTPDNNMFMDYCMWFLEKDFNTLKTCYCKRVEKLDIPFGNLGGNRVLCVFNIPFEGTPLFFEEVKMQIVLTTEEDIDAFPPIKRKVELKDMAISLDFSNNSFTMVAENKSGLSVVNFRQKVLSCVKLLSLIFYSPLRIERECLFSGDLNYEYIYDAKESGRAITRLIPVNMTDVLLKGVFTQDNIEKFITNFDKDYSNLLTIYIYLLDKMNLNIRNINDFFLIQLIVSLISKLKGEWVDSKEAIDLYLNNGYIKQFNFDKDRDEAEKVLSELLRDERNYVGHLFVLYDRKNSRKRKYTGSDCLEIHDFFRLLLSVPFYIYEIFGMAISDEIITNVLDGFKSYWS